MYAASEICSRQIPEVAKGTEPVLHGVQQGADSEVLLLL
jgi:hypothetical protein